MACLYTIEFQMGVVAQCNGQGLLTWGQGLPAWLTSLLSPCALAEQRQLVLAEKFKELKRSKKLESFLSRKRRRNAGKDRRHLPLSKE